MFNKGGPSGKALNGIWVGVKIKETTVWHRFLTPEPEVLKGATFQFRHRDGFLKRTGQMDFQVSENCLEASPFGPSSLQFSEHVGCVLKFRDALDKAIAAVANKGTTTLSVRSLDRVRSRGFRRSKSGRNPRLGLSDGFSCQIPTSGQSQALRETKSTTQPSGPFTWRNPEGLARITFLLAKPARM